MITNTNIGLVQILLKGDYALTAYEMYIFLLNDAVAGPELFDGHFFSSLTFLEYL